MRTEFQVFATVGGKTERVFTECEFPTLERVQDFVDIMNMNNAYNGTCDWFKVPVTDRSEKTTSALLLEAYNTVQFCADRALTNDCVNASNSLNTLASRIWAEYNP